MSRETKQMRTITLSWMGVVFLVFPILMILGISMRAVQSNYLASLQPRFYALMTMHGLGMAGLWFVGAMGATSWLLMKYVKPNRGVALFAFAATLTGVGLLLTSTLLGRFAAGWYFLYPLPLISGGAWAPWAAIAFLSAIGVLGVGWTVWSVDLLVAVARRFSLRQALGWHYLRGETTPEVPPLVLITTVSIIAGLSALVAGVIVLALYFLQLSTGTASDALLMKNLTFFFGHTLVNITMYLGVGMVYEVLPAYAGRPWKTNTLVALAWNAVLLLVLLAYLHHLYMDFAQPRWLQVLGQIVSYSTSIPAAVMSIFGALALVYRSRMRWNLASVFLFLGVMGWAVGGVAAVIDSTVAMNRLFHNSLWVPAHFHTYFLMGVVLMVLGFAYHFSQEFSKLPEKPAITNLIVALFIVGGYGFLLMFYMAGAHFVPRRYAIYPAEMAQGATYARISLVFLSALSAGVLLYLWEVGRRWKKAFSAAE